MRFLGILLSIFAICLMSFAHISEGFAQALLENENIKANQALGQLPRGTFGYIIWMSNREGNWNVYRMDIPSRSMRKLTQNNTNNRDARISDDGRLIAWDRGDDPKREVWVMKADGTDQRMIVPNAAMGVWRPDGNIIVYRGKDYDTSFIYNIKTNEETKIWPIDNVEIKPKNVWGATLSPDGKMFVGWSPNPRGTWIFSADGKFQKHIHGGCEGSFAPDSSFVYWVMTAGTFGKATLEGEVQEPLYEIGETEYGHTYFPKLSNDMNYLIFGSCPNDQHDHDTSDYEIFLMKMDNLKPAWEDPIRLTYDPATDRWADIFVKVDETPPNAPQNLVAKSQDQAVRISWKASEDDESGILGYNVFRNSKDGVEELIAGGANNLSYVDYATDAKTKYQYAVSTVNLAGLESPKSKETTIKTKDSKPVTPANLRVSGSGTEAHLRWEANPELDIKGYNVYRSSKLDGRYKKLNKDIITGLGYIDNSVENENTYYYSITAIDKSKHESSRSEPFSFTAGMRITDGLLALYLFDEGQGSVVNDRSGIEPALKLNIRDTDRIQWVKGTNAIEFVGSSMITSDGNADKLYNSLKGKNEMSIEAWVSPNNLTQTGPSRIVSMSEDPGQRNFTLGQIGEDLAIRLRTTKTDQNGIPELDTQKRVLSQQPIHIVATYDGKSKKLYINGQLHSETQQLDGDFSNWENYPLVLGNEFTGDRTWLGKIYLVAIYGRSLGSDEIIRNYKAGI